MQHIDLILYTSFQETQGVQIGKRINTTHNQKQSRTTENRLRQVRKTEDEQDQYDMD